MLVLIGESSGTFSSVVVFYRCDVLSTEMKMKLSQKTLSGLYSEVKPTIPKPPTEM